MHPMSHVRDKEQAKAAAMCRGGGYARGGDVSQDKKMIKSALRQHENAEHGGKHESIKLRGGGKVKGEHSKPRADKMARGGRTKGGKGAVNIIIATGGGEGERQMAQKQGMQVGAALAAKQAGMGMPPIAARPPMPPPGALPPPPPGGAMGAPAGMGAPMPPPRPGMPPMKRGGPVRSSEGTTDAWREKHGGSEPGKSEWKEVQKQSGKVRYLARGGRAYPLEGDAGAGGGEGRVQKINAMPGVNNKIKVRAHERRRGGAA